MAISEKELMELQIKQSNGIKLSKDERKILKDNDKEAQERKKKMSFGERMKLASGSEYSQLMGENEEDKYPIRDWIDTGSILFNAQVSGNAFGGIPSSRIAQLVGINSSGKSYLSLETAINAQKKNYFVVIFDSEMCITKDEMRKRGLDIEHVLYIPVDTVENLRTSLLNMLDDLGEDDPRLFIICDSLGNLSTNKELIDSTDGKETADMTRSRLLKSLFRTATLKIGVKGCCMVCVNHVYAQIGGFGGNVIGGGSGSLYNSSIIVEFTKAQEKNTAGTQTIGACITSTTIKSRTSREKQKVKFSLSFDDGLQRYSGLELFCEDEKLFSKEKQSYKLNPNKVGNITLSVGELFSKAKLTDEFWIEFLDKFLAKYLEQKYKYQSSTDGILDDGDIIEE